jgi:hypothetical protein
VRVEEWRHHSEEEAEREYDISRCDYVCHEADEVTWDGLEGEKEEGCISGYSVEDSIVYALSFGFRYREREREIDREIERWRERDGEREREREREREIQGKR